MKFINLMLYKYFVNAQSVFLHSGATTNSLLKEDGFFIIQENGSRINI